MGLICWDFAPLNPFGSYPWQAYVQPGSGYQPTPGMHRVAAPSTAFSRWRSLLLLSQLYSGHSNYMVGHSAFGAWQSHPTPPPSLHGGEGSSFPGLVLSNAMVTTESVVSIKPGDSVVVSGHQVDEFPHTLSAEQFVACLFWVHW